MDLSKKVLVLPNICGIELDASGIAVPSHGTSLQPFYNSVVQNAQVSKTYFSPGKISFTEEGVDSRAGIIWKQTLAFSFPSNDPLRITRIQEFIKAKYIYIKLSGGMVFYFGRNDWTQNSKPKIAIKNNNKLTQVTYTLQSIFPAGFTNGSFDFNLTETFPINFYNL